VKVRTLNFGELIGKVPRCRILFLMHSFSFSESTELDHIIYIKISRDVHGIIRIQFDLSMHVLSEFYLRVTRRVHACVNQE
jgi:hypothetical protein